LARVAARFACFDRPPVRGAPGASWHLPNSPRPLKSLGFFVAGSLLPSPPIALERGHIRGHRKSHGPVQVTSGYVGFVHTFSSLQEPAGTLAGPAPFPGEGSRRARRCPLPGRSVLPRTPPLFSRHRPRRLGIPRIPPCRLRCHPAGTNRAFHNKEYKTSCVQGAPARRARTQGCRQRRHHADRSPAVFIAAVHASSGCPARGFFRPQNSCLNTLAHRRATASAWLRHFPVNGLSTRAGEGFRRP
jgi:hypothetical protein